MRKWREYAGDKDITMMFWLPNDTFEETVDFVKKNAEEWNSVEAFLEASLGKFAYIEVQLWYRPAVIPMVH